MPEPLASPGAISGGNGFVTKLLVPRGSPLMKSDGATPSNSPEIRTALSLGKNFPNSLFPVGDFCRPAGIPEDCAGSR